MVTGDANWTDVELQLPFEGSHGATTTSDESDDNRTITLNSSVSISTAQYKIGASSLHVAASSSAAEIGGNFSFTGDFTIEFWEYISTRKNDHSSIAFNATSVNAAYHSIMYGYWNGGSTVRLYSSSNGSSWTMANNLVVGDKLDNQWVHRALVRSGTTWYSYQNGTLYWTASLGSDALATTNQYHWIGRGYSSTSNRTSDAYYDGVRVTPGVARYTANFTPSTSSYYTGATINIVDTKYISQIGGWDDTDVDYGIKKISNSELSVKKMGADDTARPIDRLYVNVQKLGSIGQGVGFNQIFTGDGTTTNYLLTDSVSNTQDLLVSVQGFVQTPNIDYTLAGKDRKSVV